MFETNCEIVKLVHIFLMKVQKFIYISYTYRYSIIWYFDLLLDINSENLIGLFYYFKGYFIP